MDSERDQSALSKFQFPELYLFFSACSSWSFSSLLLILTTCLVVSGCPFMFEVKGWVNSCWGLKTQSSDGKALPVLNRLNGKRPTSRHLLVKFQNQELKANLKSFRYQKINGYSSKSCHLQRKEYQNVISNSGGWRQKSSPHSSRILDPA